MIRKSPPSGITRRWRSCRPPIAS